MNTTTTTTTATHFGPISEFASWSAAGNVVKLAERQLFGETCALHRRADGQFAVTTAAGVIFPQHTGFHHLFGVITGEAPAPAQPSTKDQLVAGHRVSVMRSKSDPSMRCIRVTSPSGRTYGVPVGIAMLAAGKDAWMRDVLIKCRECGNVLRIGDLETEACCATCIENDPELQ